jgi:long-chain acyl-CoA synthetase
VLIDAPWLKFYEKEVPAVIDIPDIPLYQILVDAAARVPNRPAVRMIVKYLPLGIKIQSGLTYSQLDKASNRFAAALHALGIRKGDRVAIMLPNILQQVIAFYGVLKAGAVLVNTNPTYTARELQHQLGDSGARVIVMLSGLYSRLAEIRERIAVEHVIIADLHETLAWPFSGLVARQLRARGLVADLPDAPDIHRFGKLLKQHPPRPPKVDYRPEDVALLQYTGGTTGSPRGAMLTQRNLVANTYQCKAWVPQMVYGEERLLAALPAFHVYGMTTGTLFTHVNGAEQVLVPDPRDVDHILKVVHNEKISIYPAVPAMYAAINNHPRVGEYDLRSIKICLSGGSALPVEVSNQFEKLTGGRLVEGYGLTESSPLACGNPIRGERRAGSIGLPFPSTQAAIFSLEPDEDGNYAELPINAEGELVVYGPQVMAGYWNAIADAEPAIDKTGGLHTGDIARMDEDGFIYIVDRKKDLIVASGFNIVPREVEEVLFMYDKVMEAAVAGVPHPKRGETVKAFVVLKPGQTATEEEIRNFCKLNLAPYKVPTAVEFRTELPKTQVGKVLRRLLAAEEALAV